MAAVEVDERSPAELGLEAAARFHPLLTVRGLFVAESDAARIEAALRGVLYGGRATREGDPDESAPDRFSVSRHGLLQPVPPARADEAPPDADAQ